MSTHKLYRPPPGGHLVLEKEKEECTPIETPPYLTPEKVQGIKRLRARGGRDSFSFEPLPHMSASSTTATAPSSSYGFYAVDRQNPSGCQMPPHYIQDQMKDRAAARGEVIPSFGGAPQPQTESSSTGSKSEKQ
jgi:hypothetical protein